MREKIEVILKQTVKYTLFGLLLYFGYVLAINDDPENEWIIRLIGFFAWVWVWSDIIFPRKPEDIEKEIKEKLAKQ